MSLLAPVSPTPHQREAHIICLANDTGIDLAHIKFYNEASYHFNLALENVLGMYGRGGKSAAAKDLSSLSRQVSSPLVVGQLGTSANILPLQPNQLQDTPTRLYWMNCASLALLHNSALIYFESQRYARARQVLGYAFHLLDREIPTEFYEDPPNVALVMSLHYLRAQVLLMDTIAPSPVPPHEMAAMQTIQQAMTECENALELAATYLGTDSAYSINIAQLLSWMAYCMLWAADTHSSSSLYYSAQRMYNLYRSGEQNICHEENFLAASA